jgi:hypothetical protein
VVKGREALPLAIRAGQIGAKAIKRILPPPQSLEYEKTLFPFIIFSKKRYVGNLYEDDATKKPKQKSMGIVLKRRDNAPIVKKIYGGVIDCLLNQYSLTASVAFLRNYLNDMVEGRVPLEDLVITKTLGANYKDPTKIAHRVLADRMGVRDPGNKPQINDRIPFVYIQPPDGLTENTLQGDRIEAPDYIREMKLAPDVRFYITNQILKPVCQIYGLCVEQLEDYPHKNCDFDYWYAVEEKLKEKAIYADNETKRQDKLADLRMDMAKTILFDPFLERLPEVKTTTTRTKKKPQARSDALLAASAAAAAKATPKTVFQPCLQIVFDASEVAKTKIYRGTIDVPGIWTETFELPKSSSTKRKPGSGDGKPLVTKVSTFYTLMFEHAFRRLVQMAEWKDRIMTEGLSILIHNASARSELKKAIVQWKEYEERREALLKLGDSGLLNDFTGLELYAFVAEFLNHIPHEILVPKKEKSTASSATTLTEV